MSHTASCSSYLTRIKVDPSWLIKSSSSGYALFGFIGWKRGAMDFRRRSRGFPNEILIPSHSIPSNGRSPEFIDCTFILT